MFRELLVSFGALGFALVGLTAFLFAFGVAVARALRIPTQALDERARLPLSQERDS